MLGILKVRGGRLDRDYLDEMAHDLGLDDLLLRAYRDAGLASST